MIQTTKNRILNKYFIFILRMFKRYKLSQIINIFIEYRTKTKNTKKWVNPNKPFKVLTAIPNKTCKWWCKWDNNLEEPLPQMLDLKEISQLYMLVILTKPSTKKCFTISLSKKDLSFQLESWEMFKTKNLEDLHFWVSTISKMVFYYF